MGSLLVISGPPGAGKSTVARALAYASDRSVLVEGDTFFGFLAAGAIQPWLPGSEEQNDRVVRAAASAAGEFARAGYETFYDGVVGPWSLETFRWATGLESLDYVVLLPSIEQCVERVAIRRGHGFTDEASTRAMHAQFAGADIAKRHVLLNPPTDLAQSLELLQVARDGAGLAYPRR